MYLLYTGPALIYTKKPAMWRALSFEFNAWDDNVAVGACGRVAAWGALHVHEPEAVHDDAPCKTSHVSHATNAILRSLDYPNGQQPTSN